MEAEAELLRLRPLLRLQEALLQEQEQSVSPKQVEVLMVIYQAQIGILSMESYRKATLFPHYLMMQITFRVPTFNRLLIPHLRVCPILHLSDQYPLRVGLSLIWEWVLCFCLFINEVYMSGSSYHNHDHQTCQTNTPRT